MTEIGMAIGNPYNGPRIPVSIYNLMIIIIFKVTCINIVYLYLKRDLLVFHSQMYKLD